MRGKLFDSRDLMGAVCGDGVCYVMGLLRRCERRDVEFGHEGWESRHFLWLWMRCFEILTGHVVTTLRVCGIILVACMRG